MFKKINNKYILQFRFKHFINCNPGMFCIFFHSLINKTGLSRNKLSEENFYNNFVTIYDKRKIMLLIPMASEKYCFTTKIYRTIFFYYYLHSKNDVNYTIR